VKTFRIDYDYEEQYKRLKSETYHTGFKVNYNYNNAGELANITAKDKTIWQLNEINAYGQIEQFTQNGVVTKLGYTEKGLPDYIQTKKGEDFLMNYDYGFTSDGNLQFRHDKITENKETFTYDDANHQLTAWDIFNNVDDDNYTTPRGGGSMQFALNGNVESKQCEQFLGGGVETLFEYGATENNAGPHALTGYYGNPVHKQQQKLTHTAFNKVETVSLKDLSDQQLKKLAITYGVDQQRRLTEFFAADGTSTTLKRYYFDNYEEEEYGDGSNRKIYYISGGNGLAAMYINDDANSKTGLYLAHTDYQGSLTALSDINGNVVERFAYDPWGNRRNAQKWEEALNTEGKYIYTSRGYTLHEHLDDYGLINMNGRVYDPLISRFLSPDPFVQAPNMAMGFNRYAYCLNNPMIYTDPSGEIWGLLFNAVAISAGWWAINTTANAINNDQNWFEAAKNTPIVVGNYTVPKKANFDINYHFLDKSIMTNRFDEDLSLDMIVMPNIENPDFTPDYFNKGMGDLAELKKSYNLRQNGFGYISNKQSSGYQYTPSRRLRTVRYMNGVIGPEPSVKGEIVNGFSTTWVEYKGERMYYSKDYSYRIVNPYSINTAFDEGRVYNKDMYTGGYAFGYMGGFSAGVSLVLNRVMMLNNEHVHHAYSFERGLINGYNDRRNGYKSYYELPSFERRDLITP